MFKVPASSDQQMEKIAYRAQVWESNLCHDTFQIGICAALHGICAKFVRTRLPALKGQ